MKTAIPKPSKQSIIREARDYVMIAIGMILYGIGWTVFLLPNDITTGEYRVLLLSYIGTTGFPVQYIRTSASTSSCYYLPQVAGTKVLHQNYFWCIYPHLLSVRHSKIDGRFRASPRPAPLWHVSSEHPSVEGGIGVAFSANGSTGGTDIIAAIINKYRDITLGKSRAHLRYDYHFFQLFCLKRLGKVVYGFVTLYICSFRSRPGSE